VDNDLVFATRYGTELDAANVRRVFRTVVAAVGLEAKGADAPRVAAQFRSMTDASA
jgi:hypothetical protein